MSDEPLPPGWVIVEIEDCLLPYPNGKRIRQGWSPQCEAHPAESHDDWAVLKTSAIQDGKFVEEENKKLPPNLEPRTQLEVQAGDILITCAGPRARCGVTCLVRSTRPRLLISGKMYQLRADLRIIDRHFLELFLRDSGTRKKIDEMKTGISDSGLNLTHDRFRTLKVPLPPLAEQKRIVAKIEELFSELEAGEESLRAARRQLGVYRQSILKQAFEGKLTETWRAENPDKLESPAQLLARIQSARLARYEEALKKWESHSRSDILPKPAKPRFPSPATALESEVLSGLPGLPAGWTWTKMEGTCDIVRGGSPRPAGDPKFYDGEIPFLKVADLTRVEGPYVDNYTSTIKPAGLQKTRYVEPPVLLISNSGATLGVPRICRIAATFNDGIAAFLDLDPQSHRYFYYFWTSKTAALRNIDQGAAQPNLNTDLLKTYPIPLCSLPEQQEIVRLLDEQFEAIERNEREIDAALKRSEALRQAILKKAFTGQLVPQVSTDESASTLIARIRGERVSAPSNSSRRNTTLTPAAIPAQPADDLFPEIVSFKPLGKTDLQAGIVALAIEHFEQHAHFLGHTITEKIVHLADYIAELQLDRQPVKDAAGPNDFLKAKKVEHRAEAKGWFSVTHEGAIYRYHAGRNMPALLDDTRRTLGSKLSIIRKLLDALNHMDTKSVEVFATVFAAWNNLLLKKASVTDEAIVTEARENWHKRKLEIPRKRFFDTIASINKTGFVPKGSGQLVAAPKP
jgi:type I restriction enzyme S subunit